VLYGRFRLGELNNNVRTSKHIRKFACNGNSYFANACDNAGITPDLWVFGKFNRSNQFHIGLLGDPLDNEPPHTTARPINNYTNHLFSSGYAISSQLSVECVAVAKVLTYHKASYRKLTTDN
jgi:hypothetical protein